MYFENHFKGLLCNLFNNFIFSSTLQPDRSRSAGPGPIDGPFRGDEPERGQLPHFEDFSAGFRTSRSQEGSDVALQTPSCEFQVNKNVKFKFYNKVDRYSVIN